ncbi:MAG: KH domain-containing protein [Cyanobacteria bacterium SZAS LIN-2]|nr:KH domain-containing protein [Cyanobacteria bacterium SZAS LIN-3]MBS1998158.1 KH domain-containing protein [Cyanobacteria bacterium SZAS LIN-2]
MNLGQFDDNAKSYLEKILAILDIEAVVIEEGIDETTTCFRIDCKPDDARMLIGRNGQTLESLQFIVRQMIKSNAIEQGHFIVDVLDYRGRRRRTLEENAKRGAVAVLNGEQEHFPLMPMSAYDRRLVHNYLQENFPELESGSQGEGEERHIVISFKGLDGEGGEADGEDDDFVSDDEGAGREAELKGSES